MYSKSHYRLTRYEDVHTRIFGLFVPCWILIRCCGENWHCENNAGQGQAVKNSAVNRIDCKYFSVVNPSILELHRREERMEKREGDKNVLDESGILITSDCKSSLCKIIYKNDWTDVVP